MNIQGRNTFTSDEVAKALLIVLYSCYAESAKKGMAERLAVSEDRLMRLTRDDLMASLVQAKLLLAQTDYTNLSLQV